MVSRREALKAFAGCLAALGLPVGIPTPTQPLKIVNDYGPGECFIPEMWAQEHLRILEENMVVGTIAHRDFERQTMNTRLKRRRRTT